MAPAFSQDLPAPAREALCAYEGQFEQICVEGRWREWHARFGHDLAGPEEPSTPPDLIEESRWCRDGQREKVTTTTLEVRPEASRHAIGTLDEAEAREGETLLRGAWQRGSASLSIKKGMGYLHMSRLRDVLCGALGGDVLRKFDGANDRHCTRLDDGDLLLTWSEQGVEVELRLAQAQGYRPVSCQHRRTHDGYFTVVQYTYGQLAAGLLPARIRVDQGVSGECTLRRLFDNLVYTFGHPSEADVTIPLEPGMLVYDQRNDFQGRVDKNGQLKAFPLSMRMLSISSRQVRLRLVVVLAALAVAIAYRIVVHPKIVARRAAQTGSAA